jgi:hypothetical protein
VADEEQPDRRARHEAEETHDHFLPALPVV